MKMLIDNEWLRRTITADPDMECEAGGPATLLEDLGMFLPADLGQDSDDPAVVQLHYAFGTFVRMLRRKERLTVTELAGQVRVDEEELRSIERDPHHKPRPRTVHQLAKRFKIEPRRMMKLSGATANTNQKVHEEALRFAAKSDDINRLTPDEQRMLAEFAKYVNESQDLAN
jgi:transcriptional regulator with XRE-family HTH domain